MAFEYLIAGLVSLGLLVYLLWLHAVGDGPAIPVDRHKFLAPAPGNAIDT